MALKEEIFEQNSTLFAVLDENEVTEIAAINNSVIALSETVEQNKLQLDGLAIRVDQQQARNEEQFVNINTHVLGNSDDINSLNVRMSSLTARVVELENSDNNVEELIEELETLVHGQETKISLLESQLSDLTEAFLDLRSSIEPQVAQLTAKTTNGVKILGGTQTYKIMDSFNRIMTIEINIPNSSLCYGREYDIWCTSLPTQPWVNGAYRIRFASYVGNLVLPGYSQLDIPVCTGQWIYANLALRDSPMPSSAPVPVYLWTEP